MLHLDRAHIYGFDITRGREGRGRNRMARIYATPSARV